MREKTLEEYEDEEMEEKNTCGVCGEPYVSENPDRITYNNHSDCRALTAWENE